jgi:hypothetical protein
VRRWGALVGGCGTANRGARGGAARAEPQVEPAAEVAEVGDSRPDDLIAPGLAGAGDNYRGIESLREFGMKWMNGTANVHSESMAPSTWRAAADSPLSHWVSEARPLDSGGSGASMPPTVPMIASCGAPASALSISLSQARPDGTMRAR